MKYPTVLFFRLSKYNFVDSLFKKIHIDCTLTITDNINKINELYGEKQNLIVTYGNLDEYSHIKHLLSKRLLLRHIHISNEKNLKDISKLVNEKYIQLNLLPREKIRPIFSIFSSCFNSYDKIFRAYNSIKQQTMTDWEWVIIDDSTDEKHFDFLKKISKKDKRIRLYKKDFNSGVIGHVKNEAVSLCRGKYVLELDHDDEILPDVLKDATTVFEKHPEVGFVYMDFINIYEDGTNFKYTDFLCKGYAGYYCQKYKDQWVYVYMTPNINNVTLSHLTCCPNHPRIWRRNFLNKIGNYSELLPICDDFEILLRTCLNTKVAKIPKLAYVQYMNKDNNNFSLIRNKEINRIGPYWIAPHYCDKYNIDEVMKKKNAFEDVFHKFYHTRIWLRKDGYKHVYDNLNINLDYVKQFMIWGLKPLQYHRIKMLYKNKKNDFLLLDNKHSHEEIQSILHKNNMTRMKYYCLPNTSKDEFIQYFLRLYKSCEKYEIID